MVFLFFTNFYWLIITNYNPTAEKDDHMMMSEIFIERLSFFEQQQLRQRAKYEKWSLMLYNNY